jgi:hypothetical protein
VNRYVPISSPKITFLLSLLYLPIAANIIRLQTNTRRFIMNDTYPKCHRTAKKYLI